MIRMIAAIALLPPMLAGCSGPRHDGAAGAADPAASSTAPIANSATSPGEQRFRSDRYGFVIDYPAGWKTSGDFGRSYLDNGSWKTYAGPDSVGTPVVDIIMPGSNDVTAAELRIGVSTSPAAVRDCTEPPQSLRPGSMRQVMLDGARFTRFDAADAAMSHYLTVHSLRSVHAGRCYAIDLLVTGTNPMVYDPPRTPPFSRAQAFAQLHRVLQGFRFMPATSSAVPAR